MDRYICTDCGRTFDEPHEYEERHGFTHGPYEKLSCCPYCGGGYEEAVECHDCGEPIPKSEAVLAEEDYYLCENCAEEREG